MAVLTLLAGLGLLLAGAELLVRGASRLAATLGLSPLAIGLTVVAYGTSAPEMAVSVWAALEARSEIALGNVVGSNTFNVLAILGLTAIAAPLVVADRLVRTEIPLMIAVSAAAWWLASDGRVSRAEGLALLAAAVAYTAAALWAGRRGSPAVASDPEPARVGAGRWPVDAGVAATGLVLLAWGARWMVDGAATLARGFGLSELTIGVTVVAAGTSLPELATSVVAARRGERDIAVGNVVGSNLFNLLAVLGASAALSAPGVTVPPGALDRDLPVMTVAALVCFPLALSGRRLDRWEGLLLLGGYGAYVAYLLGAFSAATP